jgi:hypothetical protein
MGAHDAGKLLRSAMPMAVANSPVVATICDAMPRAREKLVVTAARHSNFGIRESVHEPARHSSDALSR